MMAHCQGKIFLIRMNLFKGRGKRPCPADRFAGFGVSDGSGKQTQTALMYERLLKEGFPVMKVDYPNYKSESSALVKMYLRGDFGKKASDVDAYISSTFFAADRYASYKTEYEEFYQSGGIVLADRYTTSNMVHQASKITDPAEKVKYLDWLCDFEFRLYGIPRPVQVFFLDVEPAESAVLIRERLNKELSQGHSFLPDNSQRKLDGF